MKTPPFDRALTSAPASTSTRTTPAWFSAAAHISAVCPFHPSAALTLAPCASSCFTVSRLPVRAAAISAVSPSGSATLASAPAFNSFSTHGRVAVRAGEVEGRHAVAVRGPRVRAGGKQQVDRLEVAAIHGPVERGSAVGLRLVDVGLLLQQRADGRGVARLDAVDEREVGAGSADAQKREKRERPPT